jgi:hypothetical protein
MRAAILISFFAVLADAQPTATQCQTGAADILGARKAFAVQVCNLFGATCVLNHPSIASGSCATEALSIDSGECKLYPIFEYADNKVRGSSGVEEMSTDNSLGCSISSSCSNGECTYAVSGACVSVQCSLGGAPATFAGPAFSGTGNSRTAVTDTAAASTFTATTFASLPQAADQLKNVFLVRTGDYVGTSSMSTTSSNSISYSVGSLPTSDGNNYGPVACPSSGNAMDSATATGITSENLRMCGSTGKWVYYNALNFLMDKDMYAKYSANNAGTAAENEAFATAGTPNVAAGTAININNVPFLGGASAYRSSLAMDDPRKVYLHDGAGTTDVIMTSDTIAPKPGKNAPFAAETGGAWRNFGVAFYCDDYARIDLTTCAEANRKMFYVCDPSPNACFGSATAIGSNGALLGQACTENADCCSNSCSSDVCAAGCESAGDRGAGPVASSAVSMSGQVAVLALATVSLMMFQ